MRNGGLRVYFIVVQEAESFCVRYITNYAHLSLNYYRKILAPAYQNKTSLQ